jgi:hypothetical protein
VGEVSLRVFLRVSTLLSINQVTVWGESLLGFF